MSKKGSNPGPPTEKSNISDIPKTPPMPPAPAPRFHAAHMAAVFNLWNLRYSENPDQFSDSLDKNGKPIEDYGEGCAAHFQKLSDELWS